MLCPVVLCYFVRTVNVLHARLAYWGTEVQLHSFLTSAVREGAFIVLCIDGELIILLLIKDDRKWSWSI